MSTINDEEKLYQNSKNLSIIGIIMQTNNIPIISMNKGQSVQNRLIRIMFWCSDNNVPHFIGLLRNSYT